MPKHNIILYSAGLGYINRGLETFTRELYEALNYETNINVILFHGFGNVIDGAMPIWTPKRNSKLYNFLPFKHLQKQSYRTENIVFSLPIVFYCYNNHHQIIHFSETIPANILYHLRHRFGGSFKLLFSNGGPASPQHYQRYDYVQVLTPGQKQEALESGYPESRLFLVPYGLNCNLFSTQLSPEEVEIKRRLRHLPTDRSVILSVGAVNTSHKRMDWLIKEFSQLDPSQFFLWIVGQPEEETQKVKALAQALLKPDSYRFEVIPYSQMPGVYAIADYFVLCSLREGFGRVYLEAMVSGLIAIAHRNINTEWIMGLDNSGLIDMTKPNRLKEAILQLHNSPLISRARAKLNKDSAIQRFSWQVLRHEYIKMYEQIDTL
ncbi:MAG TPA: hypothetical protein DCL61_07660 [Cyanobacteria bacterium UBA12227]|nr:hypothetical protein [Cyanobacteria bacterium UBA12227]HAX88421.1 hypothetical protein [Cyanobacteria bacterium UBA11370]HBY80605.1 hypothetical protein [Cyanobacteria bacterium UBA11148]